MNVHLLIVTLLCCLVGRVVCADGSIVFNEIMYHPVATDEVVLEWVELHNQMTVDVDISGWALSDGVQFTFPSKTIIQGGEYLLIASAPAELAAVTGLANILGPFSGKLDNAGETLELRNNSGRVIDSVTYADNHPWPVAPDGGGPSLAKLAPHAASSEAENWASSAEIGGTPGKRNFRGSDPAFTALVTRYSPAKVFVPADGSLADTWTAATFDDSPWSNAVAAIGFDVGSSAHYFNEVMADAPEGYWRLDETNGVEAIDSSANGRHGTYVGGVTMGMSSVLNEGRAVKFDGASGFVQLPGSWGGASEATVEAWVNTVDPITGDFQAIISASDAKFTHFQLHTGGVTGFYTSEGNLVRLPIPPPTPTDVWRHIVMVAKSGDSRIYVDGVQFGSSVDTVFDTIKAATHVPGGTLGVRLANGYGEGRWLRGNLDEVAIYNHALTPERVVAHYTAGSAPNLTGMFGTDLGPQMFRKSSGAYLRIPFTLDNAECVDVLKLRVNYDDGFVVYLNGTAVASRNAPANPVFDSKALSNRPDIAAMTAEEIALTSFADLLVSGTNLLAFHAMNGVAHSSDFVLVPELLVNWRNHAEPLALNEISASTDTVFRVELINTARNTVDVGGYTLSHSGSTERYVLPMQMLAPTEYLVFSEVETGLRPANGDNLFLHAPTGAVADAVEVADRPLARTPDGTGPWLYATSASLGATNPDVTRDEIVINEIMYHHQPLWETAATAFTESTEEWLELHNRSSHTVDLTGWRMDGGVEFRFTNGTTIVAGGFLVVAKAPEVLRGQWPGIDVTGPLSKKLSNAGERIILKDAQDNPADDIHYYDGGQWPAQADGRGSSLELRDPRADNARGEAWGASDESGRSSWRTYTYRGVAADSLGPDEQWREFVVGLLDEGELLLDDISVIEDPDGARVQMLPQRSFSSGMNGWRVIGNHRGVIVPDPDDPGNSVMRLTAGGPTSHFSNHAETTLANGRSVVNGRVYEISYRARWISGCPRLNTRLYFNRLPRTTLIDTPSLNGTPGTTNSQWIANLGPTFNNLRHTPSVPASNESVTVSVHANDPDGIGTLTLFWRVNEGPWNSAAMVGAGTSVAYTEYTGNIPGQSAAAIIQLYVAAVDTLGATSFFPAAGPDSRALYKVEDGAANLELGHNLRIVMLPSDADAMHANSNLMSNARRGCTVVYDENEVFYDCGVRLRGSPFSRPYDRFVSFNLYFPPENLFRGTQGAVKVDRSGRGLVGSPGQDEILIKHLLQRASLPCEHIDLVRVLAPLSKHTSSAMLSLGHFTGDYLDSAYPDGSDGVLFELDGAYYPTKTVDGGAESPKIVESGPISYTDIRDLGDDPEAYRWHFVLHNNRTRDDYTAIVAMAKAFDLSGPALETSVAALIDESEWMRMYAALTLCGVTDTYTMGNPHNLWFYARPSDGRVLALPHDWDACYKRPVTAPLLGSQGNLLKIIDIPRNRRLFYGHLLDLISNIWNAAYMEPWASHYDSFLPGQNFSSIVDYITQRGNYVLGQLPAPVPFAVTTSGNELTVTGAIARVEGTGWIDINEFRIAGREGPLSAVWTSENTWRLEIPVTPGENSLTLEALGFNNELLCTHPFVITSISAAPSPRDHLRVTEIHYNPSGPDDYEFLELYNTGVLPLPLQGVRLTDAVEFEFGIHNLAPGGFVVVVRDLIAFSNRYQDATSPYYFPTIEVAGQWSGALSNSGETLRVLDATDVVIEEITYSDKGDWPARADGRGASLQLARREMPPSTPEHWRASTLYHGSPGRDDEPSPVVINELMSYSESGIDWIELLNTGTQSVDISGWFLSDSLDNPFKYTIPTPTLLPPGAYAVFDQRAFGTGTTAFAFSKLGEEAVVTEAEDNNIIRVIAYEDFSAAARDVPFGRWIRSDGSTVFTALAAATPGGGNAAPLVGPIVISEIMYHPATGLPEYLELLNITSTTIPLYDPDYPSNTWKLTSAVSYTFPPGIELPAGSRLIVAPTDAATFRGIHSISSSVSVYGPWEGALDNAGESVRLRRPGSPELDGSVPYIIIDRVDFRPYAPWPVVANGEGPSLERLDCRAFGNDWRNWWAEPGGSGTPGILFDPIQLSIRNAGELSWSAVSGDLYRVEYKDDLFDNTWNLLDERPAAAQSETILDPGAAMQRRRFYRILWLR